MQQVTRSAAAGLAAALAVLGGCADTSVPKPAAAAPSATVAASPGGPVGFDLDWDGSAFALMACPKNHPDATCYGGSAAATLPLIGAVTLRRTVIAGDSARHVKPGCDPADTTGTLTAAQGGTLPVRGTGELCGALATYLLTTGTGTGALAGTSIRATVINNGGAEHWQGTVSRQAR